MHVQCKGVMKVVVNHLQNIYQRTFEGRDAGDHLVNRHPQRPLVHSLVVTYRRRDDGKNGEW